MVKRVKLRQRAKFLATGSTIAEIWRYFDFSRWRSPPSWIFKFLKFLTVRRLKRAELHWHAKLGWNRFKHGRDMVIFRFFKMAAAAILDLLCVCSDHPRRAFGGLYRCAKFGWNRCSSFDNMHVFRFCEFGLKTPIHAPKIGVFGEFYRLNGEQCQRNPKRHILAQVRVVWAIMRENPSTRLTCRWVPEKKGTGINKKN